MARKILYLLLLVGLVVGLAACGDKDSGGSGGSKDSGDSGGSSDEEVELTMWVFPGMGIDEQIEKYQEENPNIKIKQSHVRRLR